MLVRRNWDVSPKLTQRRQAGESLFIVILYGLFVLLLSVLAVRVGFRDLAIGTDYRRYYSHYLTLHSEMVPSGRFEIGYQVLELVGAYLRLPPEYFFSLVAFLNMVFHLWAFSALTRGTVQDDVERHIIALATTGVLMAWPFYWNGVTNIIRQGLSVPFLLLYLSNLRRGLFGRALLLLVFSSLIHKSTLVFGAVSFVYVLLRRKALILVGVLVFLYAIQVPDKLLMLLERITGLPLLTFVLEYGPSNPAYRSGYRYDFLLFSLLPILLWCIIRVLLRKRLPWWSDDLVTLYSLLLLPFLVTGYRPYMDRWLFPAWTLMPYVLCMIAYTLVRPRFFGLSVFLVAGVCSIVTVILLFPFPFI